MSPDGRSGAGIAPQPERTSDASAAHYLRAVTRVDHDAVDAAFLRFSLQTRDGYRAFLTAHARVLPVAERRLDPAFLTGDWHGRSEALRADLADLGCAMPTEDALLLPTGEAARWGALYVLEGSRLGGAVLEKQVLTGLPTRFLGATHPHGAWRRFLDMLNAADTGPAWRAQAAEGAKALFGAYAVAAQTSSDGPLATAAMERS
ncbi:biliverdin-producing heme oxygenase [Sphingobium subterraneum]|uniref:Heme oxygenase n=1 Tax=Sphingobium subterraneum TaxID=627688 RepID=A0A841J3D1_9SPHN|nr:biliverdin-producing heme oxygenase [Sphingobium subterraneum]MBB6125200.1 heme oxygenase [Sphingobium subterraneum]